MQKDQIEAMLNVVAEIVKTQPDCKIYTVTTNVMRLGSLARSLHKRYANQCSYPWANTEKYEAATDRMESRVISIAAELGVQIGFQRDPRGWPIIVKSGAYESYLG